MNSIERFVSYADAFERTFIDDRWGCLEQYFTEGAIYVTLGPHAQRAEGREAVVETHRRAVSTFDRWLREHAAKLAPHG
jgi:hypothetical protein